MLTVVFASRSPLPRIAGPCYPPPPLSPRHLHLLLLLHDIPHPVKRFLIGRWQRASSGARAITCPARPHLYPIHIGQELFFKVTFIMNLYPYFVVSRVFFSFSKLSRYTYFFFNMTSHVYARVWKLKNDLGTGGGDSVAMY